MDDTDNKLQDGCSRPLSCDYLPLKKYSPTKLYNYGSVNDKKEVSVIKI